MYSVQTKIANAIKSVEKIKLSHKFCFGYFRQALQLLRFKPPQKKKDILMCNNSATLGEDKIVHQLNIIYV